MDTASDQSMSKKPTIFNSSVSHYYQKCQQSSKYSFYVLYIQEKFLENIKIEKLTSISNHILQLQFFDTFINKFVIFEIKSNCCVTYQRNGNNFVTGQISSLSFIRTSHLLENNQFTICEGPRNQCGKGDSGSKEEFGTRIGHGLDGGGSRGWHGDYSSVQ